MTEPEHRRQRIRDEIIVDTYDSYEQQLAWYTHLSDLSFPFRAQVNRRRRIGSPLLQKVEVLRLEDLDEGSNQQRVEVVPLEEEFTFWVPLEELHDVQTDDEFTNEAIKDWKFWKRD